MDNNTDIQALTSLIETTLDSADGYEEAATGARGSTLQSMLRKRSEARRAVALMLQESVRALGGEPDEEGTALACAHRFLLNLPTGGKGHDTESIVAEVQRGEAYLKAQFASAMQNPAVSPHTMKTIADARRRICSRREPAHGLNRVLHG